MCFSTCSLPTQMSKMYQKRDPCVARSVSVPHSAVRRHESFGQVGPTQRLAAFRATQNPRTDDKTANCTCACDTTHRTGLLPSGGQVRFGRHTSGKQEQENAPRVTQIHERPPASSSKGILYEYCIDFYSIRLLVRENTRMDCAPWKTRKVRRVRYKFDPNGYLHRSEAALSTRRQTQKDRS